MESARASLARCLERAEGVGLAVGPSGTGKTLLCRLLAEQLGGTFQVALLSSGRSAARRALLQAILYELGQPYRGMDEGELRLALAEYVTLDDKCPQGIVLLVDEAHTLPLRLLDEIRTLTNLAQQGEPRVRLMLAGNHVLEERFASPKLDSFNQRVAARCYLESLNRTETQEYIHSRIAAVGGKGPRLIPAEACAAVYKATDGVPRLINQVCDHALLLAYAGGLRQLEPALVEEAWADLQQLPTPWNEHSKAGGDVIEFGGLQDEPPTATEPSAELPAAVDDELPDATAGLHIMPEADEAESAESPDSMPEILPEIDAAESVDLEPVEQLQQIQEMLAEVEQEFCPVGTIGPEVELVFDQPAHPFQEPFEQEEVIADRYTPAAKAVGPAADIGALRSAMPPELLPQSVPAMEPAAFATEQFEMRQDALETPAPEWTNVAETEIVESSDEPGDDNAWPTCSVTPVQRHSYDRLFAKLRRR